MTFSVVLTTIDLTPKPNTLAETVQNLSRAGVFDSPLLSSFVVANTDSESLQYVYDAFADIERGVYIATGLRSRTANAAFGFRAGARFSEKSGLPERPWVIVLEDGVNMIDSFLEAVAEAAAHGYRFLPLEACASRNGVDCEIDAMHDMPAAALSALDARSLGFYLEDRGGHPNHVRLAVEWAKQNGIVTFPSLVGSFAWRQTEKAA